MLKFALISIILLFSTNFILVNSTIKESILDILDSDLVIGIDLGTTYSCVGVFRKGQVEIIQNELGNRITPSVVAFTDEERLVGESAKNQASLNPERTIFSVKRLIGRKYSDKEVQNDKKLLPYKVVKKDGNPYVEVTVKGEKKLYSPEEISSFILIKMKQIAENFLGKEVKNAVITVPAYFNDSQRQSTKDAGLISGLNVLRIINEPTAGAIAYGLDKKEKERNILVFDLGGGTFDVSLLSIESGVFEVIATNGDTHLGGEDFDNRVIDYLLKILKKKHDKDVSNDKSALQKLKTEVEKAKRTLSSTTQTTIEIDQLVENFDFKETLSRAKFEELNNDLFKKTMNPVEKVLKDGGMKKDEINEVVLVGGSTRIPKIQQLIKDFFQGKEPNKGINPDEAVAFGAAVQGGILSGESFVNNEIVLIDVTPLTLGIEEIGDVLAKIVPKGTTIPTKRSKTFVTTEDGQTEMEISIFEGERPMTKDNHHLGKFDLTGIPPAPAGVGKVQVTFEIDENSILKVSAVEVSTGKTEKIVISNDSGRLSKEEIEKMVKDAEQFSEQDKKIHEKIEAKNSLDNYIRSIKDIIEENNGLLNKDDKKILKNAIKEHSDFIKKANNNNNDIDKEDFENRQKELQAECDPIISKIYKKNNNDRDSENNEEPDL